MARKNLFRDAKRTVSEGDFTYFPDLHVDSASESDDAERSAAALSPGTNPSLEHLRAECKRLGYKSLYEAALADGRDDVDGLHRRSGIRDFISEGGLDELAGMAKRLGCFKSHNLKTIGNGVCALARTIHLEEFERLRNLEILNTSLGNLTVDLEAFDFSAIHEAMWGAAPNLLQLLQQTLNPKQDVMPLEYKTKSKRYVVTVLAQLAQYRNSRTNFVQSIIALYLFASKVPKR